ncbi:lipopolysaccharide biosynthesis protein [Levilactobacillus enshiensis]|uniref:lipopolysaccharide biosynthesis protein n=1 Tax=Levilactobacillus enshiensis TaxID=2590213 RepID=UPI00117AF9DA|nr:oligosaccharide flippase family protein [Levilactobacillus enshiensis]
MKNQRKWGAALSYFNIIMKNLIYFMYTPFLLRFVGQGDYGLFQMTNSVMMGLSLLSMGFSSSYVKFYIEYKIKDGEKKVRKLNGLYLLIFSVISLLSLVIGFILVLYSNKLFSRSLTLRQIGLTRELMSVLVISVAVAFISSVFDSNIIANERFAFQQGRQLFQTIAVPVICIPLVLLGVGVLSIAITQLVVTIVFLILNVQYCLKQLEMKFTFQDLSLSMFKDIGLFSFFIFLNQIVDLVNNNAPNFILGMVRGADLVATFSIAILIKNMFYYFSNALSSMFIPRVNELVNHDSDMSVLTDLMIRLGRIQMSVLCFILGGFVVVGQYFINVWAGHINSQAYLLVLLMVIPALVPFSQNIGIEIQRALNMQLFRSVVYIVFAIVNIVLTTVGAIKFGLIGAAFGYIISVVCANGFLMNWYYQRRMGLNMLRYWKETLNVIIPAVVSVSFLLILKMFFGNIGSFLLFVVYGLAYVIIYITIYLGFIANRYEKRLISDSIRR